MITWLLLGGVIALTLLLGYGWKNWVRPWRRMEEMIQGITSGGRPRTFLMEGGAEPKRVALMLEELVRKQRDLDTQIMERGLWSQTIFAAMQDGLLVLDPERRITLANRSFAQLFPGQNDFAGHPLLDVIRDPVVDRLVGHTLRTGEPERGELEITESARRLQVGAVAMKSESGETTGAVILFHDITQLRQSDEVRRDFVANVSHELRTPLSILRGYIETLLEDPATSPDELRRILDVMKRHSNRLGALVDDLLTLARLESTTPNLQFADVRLSEVFAAIVRDWGKKFAEKRLSVDLTIDPNLPLLRADETRLQEILYNLLDNALKYTEPGGRIRLQAHGRNGEIELSVSDTGSGIPEGDLARVFERFYRADKARSREVGGTGLGLSIVKHIAQMHGGRVEAESEFGRGTTIRVVLPADGPAESVPVTES